MARALEQARAAAAVGEVPVGAVLVREGRLLTEAHNLTVTRGDPTAHAERLALSEGARRLGDWRLLDTTLYVTLEPCAMCAGALVLGRVPRLVYGAADPKAGMVGSLGDLARDPRLNHRARVTSGVLAEASSALLRGFFRERRGTGGALALALGVVLALGGCTLAGVPAGDVPAAGRPGDAPPASSPPPARPAPPPAPPGRAAAPGATRPAPLTFPEVRALWVVRTTLATPEGVTAMVERAHQAGFNTLLVQVRGRGDAWYASLLEPRPPDLASRPDFDPLALAVREAHARGIAVHVWVNALLVAGLGPLPTDPSHLAVAHPAGLAVPRALAPELLGLAPDDPAYVRRLHAWADANRNRVEGLFASPSDPRVRARLRDVVDDLASRYDVDGLHLDYIRYPGPDFDYARGTLEAFREWMAERLPPERRAAAERARRGDPLAYTAAFPEAWGDFRREQITRLAEEAAAAARSARPGIVVSAAVFPDPVDARRSRFQDWSAWSRWGLVDAVAPMAYTGDDHRYRVQIADAVEAAGAARVWAGVGVYQTTFQGTLDRVRWAREMGTAGFSLFSYDWAVASGEADGGVGFLERVGRAVRRP